MKREWVEQEKWWLCRGDESGGREKKNKRVRVSGTEGWNGKREKKRKKTLFNWGSNKIRQCTVTQVVKFIAIALLM